MTNPAPIGVFDSGMGGLTVVREMMKQLPNESIIYFGDTARVPYGPKSPDTVLRYSREITAYLKDEGVKALVIACNTATAHALPALRRENDIPIVGVIQPGARAAAAATKTQTRRSDRDRGNDQVTRVREGNQEASPRCPGDGAGVCALRPADRGRLG